MQTYPLLVRAVLSDVALLAAIEAVDHGAVLSGAVLVVEATRADRSARGAAHAEARPNRLTSRPGRHLISSLGVGGHLQCLARLRVLLGIEGGRGCFTEGLNGGGKPAECRQV